MSEPNNDNVPPRVEIIPPGGGFGRDGGRQSFLTGYLKKAGKITAFMAIVGCCFMIFAAWMIASTFERILSAASQPLVVNPPGK